MNKIDKQSLIGLGPNNKLIKEYKASLGSLSAIQKDSLIGLLLGDAAIQTQNKGNTYRIKFEWSEKHRDYIDHVFNLFDEWFISPPHKKSRLSPKGNLVVPLRGGFNTISHEAFNPLADIFLKNGKKSIATDLVKNHLTHRGLAYWFMDDGGKLDYNKNSKNKSIVLNTQSFTQSEVEEMTIQLSEKFNFECEVRQNKGRPIIVIKAASYPPLGAGL